MLSGGNAGDVASGADAGAARKPPTRGTGAIELFKDRVTRQARELGQRGRRMPWHSTKNLYDGERAGKPPLKPQATEGAEDADGPEEDESEPDLRRSRAYVGLEDATSQARGWAAHEGNAPQDAPAAAPEAVSRGRARAGSAPKSASGFAAQGEGQWPREGRRPPARSTDGAQSGASAAGETGAVAGGPGAAAAPPTSAPAPRVAQKRGFDSVATAPAPTPAPAAAPISPSSRSRRRQGLPRRDVLGRRGEQGKAVPTATASPGAEGLGLLGSSRDDEISTVPPPDKAAEKTIEAHAQALSEFASSLPSAHASAVSYVSSHLRDGWRRLAAAESKLSEEVQSAKGELESLQTSVRDLADRADKWDARLRRMVDAFEGEQAGKERELRDKLGDWMRERIQQRERTTIDMYKGELNRVKKLIQERQRDDDREAWLTAAGIKVLRWFLNGLSLAASVIMFVVSLVAEPFLKLVGAPPMQPPQFPAGLVSQPRGESRSRRRRLGATSPAASPPVAAALASITGNTLPGSSKPTPRPSGGDHAEGGLSEEGSTA